MILYLLLGLCIGIEGGYMYPAVGFQDIKYGAGFSAFADRDAGVVDLTFSLRAAFHTGDNPGYAMSTAGFAIGCYKKSWPVSPVFTVGADYISRTLNQAGESGVAATYGIGVRINFKVDRLYIYPEARYGGLTDLEVHAGFIGLTLGIGYEI
ncbi:hypothetical protein IBX73_04875 [candidate division WOR-3 bacterium]|nr:hypothetical protein [candidate division WOR-3 bacterium]